MEKKCQYPECETILSQYNEYKVCFIHQRAWAQLLDKEIDELNNERIRAYQKYLYMKREGNKKAEEKWKKLWKRLSKQIKIRRAKY